MLPAVAVVEVVVGVGFDGVEARTDATMPAIDSANNAGDGSWAAGVVVCGGCRPLPSMSLITTAGAALARASAAA